MNTWKAMTLAGLLLPASNSPAQSKSCQVYGGVGITPLFYQTMAQAKMGYCLTEKLKIEASFVIVRDKLNGLFEQKFYSLGLKYPVWSGWYAMVGAARSSGVYESEDGKIRVERKSRDIDMTIGYEYYWKNVPLFFNFDLLKSYRSVAASTDYYTDEVDLNKALESYSRDLSETAALLIVSFGVYL